MAEAVVRNISLEELDQQTHLHPYSSLHENLEVEPVIFETAKGIRVKDSKGREYIDGFAGMACCTAGYGRQEIVEAAYQQLKKLAWYHTIEHATNEPVIHLADKLLQLGPDNMVRAFFTCSGSEANDTQARLVWNYNHLRGKPEKRKIFSVKQGYHGSTIVAASMTGVDLCHTNFGLPLPGFIHLDCPHYYGGAEPGMSETEFADHLIDKFDQAIEREGPETCAAYIQEPVLGGGGGIVPPATYMPKLKKLLEHHDMLYIDDEVVCGFGRLGRWFGHERFDVTPDLMSVAKGITSAYYPISACLISSGVWDVLLDGSRQGKVVAFGHGNTYCGNPVGAATALANIALLERENLVGNADKMGAYMGRKLKDAFADDPIVGDVRGMGLYHAVELAKDKKNKTGFDWDLNISHRMFDRCKEEGLIIHCAWPNTPACNSVMLAPPICITRSEVDEVVARLRRGMDKLKGDLERDGIWNG